MTMEQRIGLVLLMIVLIYGALSVWWRKRTAPMRRKHVLMVQAMDQYDRFRHSIMCYRRCPWREYQRTGELP